MQYEVVTYDGHTYYLTTARCCRDWPVALGFHIGRCGYCGQRPAVVTTADNESSDPDDE